MVARMPVSLTVSAGLPRWILGAPHHNGGQLATSPRVESPAVCGIQEHYESTLLLSVLFAGQAKGSALLYTRYSTENDEMTP